MFYAVVVFIRSCTRIWNNYYKAFTRLLQSCHKASTKLLKVIYKVFTRAFTAFTMFFASVLQCFLQGLRHCVRVAKEMDSKSIGLWPQGLESPRCRCAIFTFFTRLLQCFGQDFTRFSMLLQGLHKAFNCFLQGFYKAFARPSQGVYNVCVTRFLRGVYKSACSVAAAYKPPMLVPRVRLPAGAPHVISPWTAASNTVFCKAFTLFLHSFYNVCSRGFHNVFCEGFTRLSQCFIMLSQGFDKVFTTFSLGFS